MKKKNTEKLCRYIFELAEGRKTRALFDMYREALETCSPGEVNDAIDRYMATETDYEVIEGTVARFIRACGAGLDRGEPVIPGGNEFLAALQRENRELELVRSESTVVFRSAAKEQRREEATYLTDKTRAGLAAVLRSQLRAASHYLKLQHTLFPALEEFGKNMGCLKLMWHIQDRIIGDLKACSALLETEHFDFTSFNRIYGRAFLSMGNLIYREQKILYPLAAELIPEDRFPGMDAETERTRDRRSPGAGEDGFIDLTVGSLSSIQIDLILTNLPLDITFVDEHDRVRYFSAGKERIFPRTPGIIGRNVENCHPPKSLAAVQRIIEEFKARKRDTAEFWINLDGRMIHIRYFALFEDGEYRGVLEVSQDVTGIQSLKGERRLPDEA